MMSAINFRYIVNDVEKAIEFYTKMLEFEIVMHPAPEFAIVSREGIQLYLTKPSEKEGGGYAMPDGTPQIPGGWNRISIEVEDLDSLIEKLKKEGCRFRNEMVKGVGGKQILLLDPSDNLIELFQYFQHWKPKQ